ncbi:MerR family transcriptional regulator [Halalkalibacter alkaliphilus]|uniref:MerR family transcriptional regulator n=1 Tax=Halalkalibacter alkaliphilus TaxID=2917993 RepID=A0A9X2CV24_9BACI|nr:MerR family transcriptional regulator [Halalkalibacter alkaliphilus]MCL7748789.1 MerR family transcriptional regulator [Halalkalibacter alkaliphilus]
MKGIEIAKKLNISTSALRHYESWGLIPAVERAENGYRIYTNEHELYFKCIRSLLPGFGMDLVKKVMPLIKNGKIVKALWLINKAQVELYKEKETVKRTVDILDLKKLTEIPNYHNIKYFTIGEVAREANVSASAIRHWEKEGLINPERHKESGFRIYSPSDIRRVLIIRTVQRVVYSLDIVREVLSDLEKNNVGQAKKMALKSLEYIDYALTEQVRGIASIQYLLDAVNKEKKEE